MARKSPKSANVPPIKPVNSPLVIEEWPIDRPTDYPQNARKQVDYRKFKQNKLVLKPGVVIPEGVNNFGMKLVQVPKCPA